MQEVDLKTRLNEINFLIKNACERVQRDAVKVKLLPVTKGQPIEKIKDAFSLGLKAFGESYAQELLRKNNELPENIKEKIKWHFIGYLQKNKVKKILPIVSLIQSVDSLELAEKINSEAEILEMKAKVLIEINIANESSKSGIKTEELHEFLFNARHFSSIEIQGLMCIAPLTEKENTRPYFKRMAALMSEIRYLGYKNLNPIILSMGMSNDFDIAIEEGSTMVRIGTKLFGERKK